MTDQLEARRAGIATQMANSRPVNTFILRRWPPDSAGTHYEVAHVQSGQRAIVADLPAASAWMGGFTAAPVAAAPDEPGGTN